jgi:hypothetical protein
MSSFVRIYCFFRLFYLSIFFSYVHRLTKKFNATTKVTDHRWFFMLYVNLLKTNERFFFLFCFWPVSCAMHIIAFCFLLYSRYILIIQHLAFSSFFFVVSCFLFSMSMTHIKILFFLLKKKEQTRNKYG